MKKLFCVFAMFLFASTAHADSSEMRFLLNAMSPQSPYDNWESAFGLDVEVVQWLSPAVGLAGSVGIANWSANDAGIIEYDHDSGTTLSTRMDGNAMVFPVGMSVLLRPVSNHTANVTFEAGVRYGMVSSDVFARYAIDDASGYEYEETPIELDDVFYGLIAMDIAFPLSPYTRICLGAGYQFDISSGDASFENTYIGENEFEASIVRIGLEARF